MTTYEKVEAFKLDPDILHKNMQCLQIVRVTVENGSQEQVNETSHLLFKTNVHVIRQYCKPQTTAKNSQDVAPI